jgi:hypothetical protein
MADERWEVILGDTIGPQPGTNLSGAEIGIIVSYHPWIIPWEQEKPFLFYTLRRNDGSLYWVQVPAD